MLITLLQGNFEKQYMKIAYAISEVRFWLKDLSMAIMAILTNPQYTMAGNVNRTSDIIG